MKKILLTILTIILMSVHKSHANRVGNGDGGLFLSENLSLPIGNELEKLKFIYENGYTPSADFLTVTGKGKNKSEFYWEGIFVNSFLQISSYEVVFKKMSFGLLGDKIYYYDQYFVDPKSNFYTNNPDLVFRLFTEVKVYNGQMYSGNYVIRAFQDTIVLIKFPNKQGNCYQEGYYNGYEPESVSHICTAIYLYKKLIK